MKAIQSIKKGLAMVLAAALVISGLYIPADTANAATVPVSEDTKVLEVGDDATLFVTPDTATPTDANRITWDVPAGASSVVTVSASDGSSTASITAVGTGSCVITAKKGGVDYKKWNVTVSPKTQIGLNKTEITLKEGEGSESLTATVTPDNGRVTWSSSESSVIVSPSVGRTVTVTATVTGVARRAVITASVKNVHGEDVEMICTVNVTSDAVQVESVSLDKTTLALTVGGSETLTATITPSNAINQTKTWKSSDPAVATVDQNGKVTAMKAGTATITVKTANGKTATCTVTVTAGGTTTTPVTGVKVTPPNLDLKVNETFTLTATVEPSNASSKKVTWSTSAPTVATVDASTGAVKALAVGTAVITATTADGGKTATCTVTVTAATTNVPVTGVSLNAKTLVVGKGATRALTATVAPANATNKTVAWKSSATAIATVDTKGNVKGIKKGTATITATTADGNKTATCTVTVTEVTLNKTALTLGFGQSSIELKATLSNAKVDRLTSWKTSNATIVRVDARTGKLTAGNKAGTANITVTTQAGATAVCAVTVKEPAVKSVTLGVKKLTMGVKESYKLNATVNPANAGNKKVTWTSDKPKVVKVQNGKLTALKTGKAKITVTSQADKSKKATITVTVKKTPDKKAKVTLNKKKVNLKVKKTFQIKAKISSKYGCASFKYTVDKKGKKVVKVDKNGKVTAKKKGKATITVKPYNGKGKSAKLQITVK